MVADNPPHTYFQFMNMEQPIITPAIMDAVLATPDKDFAHRLLQGLAQKAEAIYEFDKIADALSDEAYWGFLGALFVGNADHADVQLWRRLLSSNRRSRTHCLMNPIEYRMWRHIPPVVNCYRVHMPDETDWLLNTVNTPEALAMAMATPGAERVAEYFVRKRYVNAVFTRRGRLQILVLDPGLMEHVGDIPVLKQEPDPVSADVSADAG